MSIKLSPRVEGDQLSPRVDGTKGLTHGNPLFDFDPGAQPLISNEALLLSHHSPPSLPEWDVTGKKKPLYNSKRPVPKLTSSPISPRSSSKRYSEPPKYSPHSTSLTSTSSTVDCLLRPRNVFITVIVIMIFFQTSYHLQVHRQLSKLLKSSLPKHRPVVIQEVETALTPITTPTPAKFVRFPKLKRKYLFCIHPGRSGSQYFAALLREAGIRSAHEPEPKVNGYYLQLALQSGLKETEETRLPDKSLALFEVWQNKEYLDDGGNEQRTFLRDIYAETSSMFIKTWSDIIGYLPKYPGVWEFRIVILRRYLPLVVKSQYELGWFHPTHTQRGVSYYGLHDVNPTLQRLPPLKPEKELTRWEQIIGYNIDIEILAQRFIQKYQKHVFVTEVRLEDLVATPEIASDILNSVVSGAKVWKLPKVVDTSSKGKNFNTTLEEATEQIFAFINAYRRKGVKLPLIPHLQAWDLADPFRNVKRN